MILNFKTIFYAMKFIMSFFILFKCYAYYIDMSVFTQSSI